MPPRSLIHAVQERYLSSIRSVETPSRWKILVTDSFTHTLLFSVLKTDQILQENVTSIESIEHKRQPQPSFDAAYFLCPTSANVEAIIRDLAPDDKSAQPKYAAGHIFFIDALSEPLLRRLTSSRAEPKLKKLVELYVNLWPLEAQVFSLKTPQSFHNIFQPLSNLSRSGAPSKALEAIEDELQFSTAAILNACVTLNEFPLIRYYNPSHPPLGPLAPPPQANTASSSASQIATNAASSLYASSARMARLRGAGSAGAGLSAPGMDPAQTAPQAEHFARKLAFRVQKAIDDYISDNEPRLDTSRPRGVLFITDRSMDPVAPFLHEFSYQAMCNDLLPIEDNGTRYKYSFHDADGRLEEKEATLSEEDSIWIGVRHLHIAEAIERLTRDFKKHADDAGVFSGNKTSLNDMKDMLVALPHMQEMKEKLSLHISMAQACMARFEQTKLPQQAMVEQNCATRLTPEGQKPKTLVEEMVPLLDDRHVSNMDKVRIIALYIMYCDGVPDEDRRRLFQHARLSLHEMDAVDNLVHLGACIVKDPNTSALGGWDAWFKKGKRKQQPTGEEYDVSRYQPLVKLMVEDHFAGKLDSSQYPYVRDGPSGDGRGVEGSNSSSGLSLGGGSSLSLASFRGGSTGLSVSPSPSPGPGGRPQPNSLRSAKPAWATKGRQPGGSSSTAGTGAGASYGGDRNGFGRGGGLDSRDKRQRILVFVAGGMTYSEIRSAYELSEKLGRDMYIGSSHTFTPESFVNALRAFGKSGGGGHAVPGSGAMGSSPGYEPRGVSASNLHQASYNNNGNSQHSNNGHGSHHHASHPSYGALGGNGHSFDAYGGTYASAPPRQPAPPPVNQSTYDRRFGGAVAPAVGGAGAWESQGHTPSPAQRFTPPQHSYQFQHHQTGNGMPQSYRNGNESHQYAPQNYSGGRAPSPSPSDQGKIDKKKSRNPFSRKK
ncbi:syntaxin binding protein 1 [Tilletia horrida]|uniref:Syntaxin binding protein 1 n=1 Tax=Tilletia horrida TaxID=155126 RepID=A0AAN6G7C0_9BASI|nr:syntaxin binding protein 1 [Tilletia horrida]